MKLWVLHLKEDYQPFTTACGIFMVLYFNKVRTLLNIPFIIINSICVKLSLNNFCGYRLNLDNYNIIDLI